MTKLCQTPFAASVRWLAAVFSLLLGADVTNPVLYVTEPVWQSVEGSRFTLLTTEKSAVAVEAATEIQHFINGLQHIIATDESRAPHLTIVLLTRSGDFKPYRPMIPRAILSRSTPFLVAKLVGECSLPEMARR